MDNFNAWACHETIKKPSHARQTHGKENYIYTILPASIHGFMEIRGAGYELMTLDSTQKSLMPEVNTQLV